MHLLKCYTLLCFQDDCVKSVMENVSFVTRMCDPAPWSESVTSATMEAIR